MVPRSIIRLAHGSRWKASCHVSQQAFVEGLLHKLNLNHIVKTNTPYRLGVKINRIKQDGVNPSNKSKLVNDYQ